MGPHVDFIEGGKSVVDVGMGEWLVDVFLEVFHVLGITKRKDMANLRVCYP